MTLIDCQTATDPETGATYVQIPDGYAVCLIPRDQADGVWRECAAVRIAADPDGTVAAIETTNDMDWLTSPEADLGA